MSYDAFDNSSLSSEKHHFSGAAPVASPDEQAIR
jgi:hypothetical protein